MKIPFMDLHRQYIGLKSDIDSAIQSVIDSSEFVGGRVKTEFEENFARACGAKHCIGVANGTDAITLCLKAMGIGAGDEVVVPTATFIATSEAVSASGARPVFCDSNRHTYLMDFEKLEEILAKRAHSRGGKVKAVVPVHLYGRLCPMPQLMALAQKYEVQVIEDSAQAHLAELGGKKAGTFGAMATFSFYPGKNLGAYGDAGAIVTDNDHLAAQARLIANHGRVSKYDHIIEGFNSRLDSMQAAILNVKLPHLESWSEARRRHAKRYNEILGFLENKIQLPQIPAGREHVFHLYVIRVPHREKVQAELTKQGVQTIVHYPIALHNLKAYAHLGHKPSDFPVANEFQNQILSLPLFPEMSTAQQDYVATSLEKALS